MKLSERWLRDHVDPKVNVEALCEQLTNLGLEVDGHSQTYEHLTGVTVAEVESVQPLEATGGKSLNVCTVNTADGTVQVVCGASNVKTGLRTAYARVGATLFDRENVSASKLHGVESQGMLCSGAELGVDADASGVLEIHGKAEIGTDVKQVFGLDDETVDIDLTPNRGDCLSIRGVARELGVINRMAVRESKASEVKPTHELEVPIKLDNPQSCPRYLGRIFKSINPNATTPPWMVQYLIGCGLRPISPVVDVTNFVMLELGQPLHAFDLVEVQRGIVVRDSRPGEKLTLLDGTEIEFDSPTLLITDGETPLAIAGVMGGERSGISPDTSDVFLECAYFDADAIIGTPRAYGLQTDASMRYERGVDPGLQYVAMARASELLAEIVGGEAGPVTVAESPSHLPQSREITLRKSRLTMLVGEAIPDSVVEDIFERLGFDVTTVDDRWAVDIPSHRFDLTIEEDLVEEICRVYGYNQIGSSHPLASLSFDEKLARESESLAPRRRMAELGYYEVINYSFIEKALNDRFVPGVSAPEVSNPIASQYESMRKSLIPGLLASANHNLARQQDTVRLFEYGKCFSEHDGTVNQIDRIGGIALGSRFPESWAGTRNSIDFYDVKGDVERLLGSLGSNVSFERANCAHLHPGQAASVHVDGELRGYLGKLHPEISMSLELPEATFAFELDASTFDVQTAHVVEHIAPFPYVRRDLALLVDREIPAKDLCDSIREEIGDLLTELTVFDVYEGESLGQNLKSVGIGMLLQDKYATLRDDDVNVRVDAVAARLNREHGAQRR